MFLAISKSTYFVALVVLFGCAALRAQSDAPATDAEHKEGATAEPRKWKLGPMEVSGFVDFYGSYNANHPADAANGQVNDGYNFNDKTNQVNLNGLKLTLNHDPAPFGAHVDVLYGRANKLIDAPGQLEYVEQAFLSWKPKAAKGFEVDLGKFATSAGAEVIESKDNWHYSRSLLFVYATPYYHFGLRTSYPATKTWTGGVQIVNGWNNVTHDEDGVTLGLTSALVKPKYTWNANWYTGHQQNGTAKPYRNLIDNTLLLTPNAKFNAYVNYDYGQDRTSSTTSSWQGIAVAAREQMSSTMALVGRGEYFSDPDGYTSGTKQAIKEFTATYEYKYAKGILARAEWRYDWSNQRTFHKDASAMVDSQATFTVGVIAFFGPNR